MQKLRMITGDKWCLSQPTRNFRPLRINMMLRKQQPRIKKFMKKGEDNDEQFEKKKSYLIRL